MALQDMRRKKTAGYMPAESCEQMVKETIVKDDGRLLHFYSFRSGSPSGREAAQVRRVDDDPGKR